MSKASAWGAAEQTRRQQSTGTCPTFLGEHEPGNPELHEIRVDEKGRLYIYAAERFLYLDPTRAVALGRWLLDTFGEETT